MGQWGIVSSGMGGCNKNVALPWGKAYNGQDQLSGKVCKPDFLISLWMRHMNLHRLPFEPKDTGRLRGAGC